MSEFFSRFVSQETADNMAKWVQETALPTLWGLLLIVVVAWVANRIFRFVLARFINWLKERFEAKRDLAVRIDTLASVLRFTWTTALVIVVVTMALNELGVMVAPILAGAGIVGLAVGFGAQNLVRDVITGFFLLLENHYGVGDVVQIAGIGGAVEAMNLRFTTLRDLQGTVHTIPHGQVETVSNMTREWSRVLLHVGVDYGADPDRVIEVLSGVCKEFYEDPAFGPSLLEEPEVAGVESLEDSAVVYRVIGKTLPVKQWELQRELRRRLLKRLAEAGIEIPFPQRTLSLREKDPLLAALSRD